MSHCWVGFCDQEVPNKWSPSLVGKQFKPKRKPRCFGSVPIIRCVSSRKGLRCLRRNTLNKRWYSQSPTRPCDTAFSARLPRSRRFSLEVRGQNLGLATEDGACRDECVGPMEYRMKVPTECNTQILNHMRCNCSACMNFACHWRNALKNEFKKHVRDPLAPRRKPQRWMPVLGRCLTPDRARVFERGNRFYTNRLKSGSRRYRQSPQMSWWFGDRAPSQNPADGFQNTCRSCGEHRQLEKLNHMCTLKQAASKSELDGFQDVAMDGTIRESRLRDRSRKMRLDDQVCRDNATGCSSVRSRTARMSHVTEDMEDANTSRIPQIDQIRGLDYHRFNVEDASRKYEDLTNESQESNTFYRRHDARENLANRHSKGQNISHTRYHLSPELNYSEISDKITNKYSHTYDGHIDGIRNLNRTISEGNDTKTNNSICNYQIKNEFASPGSKEIRCKRHFYQNYRDESSPVSHKQEFGEESNRRLPVSHTQEYGHMCSNKSSVPFSEIQRCSDGSIRRLPFPAPNTQTYSGDYIRKTSVPDSHLQKYRDDTSMKVYDPCCHTQRHDDSTRKLSYSASHAQTDGDDSCRKLYDRFSHRQTYTDSPRKLSFPLPHTQTYSDDIYRKSTLSESCKSKYPLTKDSDGLKYYPWCDERDSEKYSSEDIFQRNAKFANCGDAGSKFSHADGDQSKNRHYSHHSGQDMPERGLQDQINSHHPPHHHHYHPHRDQHYPSHYYGSNSSNDGNPHGAYQKENLRRCSEHSFTADESDSYSDCPEVREKSDLNTNVDNRLLEEEPLEACLPDEDVIKKTYSASSKFKERQETECEKSDAFDVIKLNGSDKSRSSNKLYGRWTTISPDTLKGDSCHSCHRSRDCCMEFNENRKNKVTDCPYTDISKRTCSESVEMGRYKNSSVDTSPKSRRQTTKRKSHASSSSDKLSMEPIKTITNKQKHQRNALLSFDDRCGVNSQEDQSIAHVYRCNLQPSREVLLNPVDICSSKTPRDTSLSRVDKYHLKTPRDTSLSRVDKYHLKTPRDTSLSRVDKYHLKTPRDTSLSHVDKYHLKTPRDTSLSRVDKYHLKTPRDTSLSHVDKYHLKTPRDTSLSHVDKYHLKTPRDTSLSRVDKCNLKIHRAQSPSPVDHCSMKTSRRHRRSRSMSKRTDAVINKTAFNLRKTSDTMHSNSTGSRICHNKDQRGKEPLPFGPSERAMRDERPKTRPEWLDKHLSLMTQCSDERQKNAKSRMKRIVDKTHALSRSTGNMHMDLGVLHERLDKVKDIQQRYFEKVGEAVQIMKDKSNAHLDSPEEPMINTINIYQSKKATRDKH